jgi:hypothetical protein
MEESWRERRERGGRQAQIDPKNHQIHRLFCTRRGAVKSPSIHRFLMIATAQAL